MMSPLEPQTPTGPKGEKRSADVIGAAVKVMRIATREEPEDCGPETAKDRAAQEPGRKGGKKRAESVTPEQRAKIAKKSGGINFKLRHYQIPRSTVDKRLKLDSRDFPHSAPFGDPGAAARR